MRARALFFALLTACNLPAGASHSVQAVVRDAGGHSVLLDHAGVPEVLPAAVERFEADPNLSRQVKAGDLVTAQLLLNEGQAPRVIGFKVLGFEEAAPALPVHTPALAPGEVLPALTVPGVGGDILLGAGQGVPTVLTFLFTSCPMPEKCPLIASKIVELQPLLAGRARVVTVTLDPARDSLGVLEGYAQARGGDPSVWKLGRLEPEALATLLQRAGASRVETPTDILHSLHILVLDAEGRLVWRGDDNRWDPATVAAQVLGQAGTAQPEAAQPQAP